MQGKIIKTTKEIISISKKLQKKNKKVGLVLGGFDILHLGHINLFKLANKYVDVLILGLDNDKTLRLTKGNQRPINNYIRRSKLLSNIVGIDYIFKIGKVFKHGDISSDIYIENLYRKIKPTHIFTHTSSDKLSKKRQELSRKLNIRFVEDKTKTITHSSKIIKLLEKEL